MKRLAEWLARRLPSVNAMAKSKKRDGSVSVLDRNAGAPKVPGDTTAAHGDRESIAARAYELFIQHGGRVGRDLDDWLEAERELAKRSKGNTTPDNAT